MNRKKLYNDICSLGLQDEVKSKYGKNYTQCKNDELKHVIDTAVAGLTTTSHKNCECGESNPLITLVDILAKKKILLKSEVEKIMNA